MVVLTLIVLGFWLIVLVIHFEIRKREVEECVLGQLARHEAARLRVEEFELELRLEDEREEISEASDEAEESSTGTSGSSESAEKAFDSGAAPQRASTALPEPLLDPTPAQFSALVAPSPDDSEPVPHVYDFVQQVARDQPELATATIRRLIEQDPRPAYPIF